MAWTTTDENSNSKGCNLRKSASTHEFNKGPSNLTVREARSFTGALDELKNSTKLHYCCQHERNISLNQTNNKQDGILCHENGYVTKEFWSNQVYLVKDEMLTYRGKRYSINEIATKWKKDCRMWLWKNKMSRRNKCIGELREKIQNLKILNRSTSV